MGCSGVQAVPKTLHSHGCGVAGELEPTQTPDCHDAPRAEGVDGGGEGGFRPRRAGCGGHKLQPRPTYGAGDRLSVEPAVGRVLVLPPACLAEREGTHGGAIAVVRKRLDNGEAGPTVGAVGEWIAVAATGGIQSFRQAGGAGRPVGRDGENLSGRARGAAREDGRRRSRRWVWPSRPAANRSGRGDTRRDEIRPLAPCHAPPAGGAPGG
jgi:hypothetical protein